MPGRLLLLFAICDFTCPGGKVRLLSKQSLLARAEEAKRKKAGTYCIVITKEARVDMASSLRELGADFMARIFRQVEGVSSRFLDKGVPAIGFKKLHGT